jgi:hypothetical protein
MLALLNDAIFGRGADYYFRQHYNEEEGQLYLSLDRRYPIEAETFRCEIRDPAGLTVVKEFAQAGHPVVRYPTDVKEAKARYKTAPRGRYRVIWRVSRMRGTAGRSSE